MDPVTHLAVGFTLARTGAGKAAPLATTTILAASLIPDLEIVHLAVSPANYIFHSGSWGHSLTTALGLGAAVALPFWLKTRKSSSSNPYWKYFAVALLGVLTHILLDGAASIRIQLLYPFKPTLFALEWLPMTDFLLLFILLVALLLPLLFRLISEEIGAPKTDTGIRWGARLGLLACLLLIAGRGMLHADAVQLVANLQFRSGVPKREAAFPTPANPFRWVGVAETGKAFELAEVKLFGAQAGIEATGTRFKPQDHPALEAAQKTESAQLFLRRARLPRASIIRLPNGWRVELEDMRFAADSAAGPALAARIDLDSQNNVIEESLRWGIFGAWED